MSPEATQQPARRRVILSGIQPSGELCIGNHIGAMRNWVSLQQTHDCIFLVVDLHALTVPQPPAELRKRCLSFAAQYVAAGIDPALVSIAIQSHIPQHAELSWVLTTLTGMGELGRMTQFKDKSARQEHVGTGLFTYPVLMAADILLYQTDLVPVGADQIQHLELTRNLAERFNHQFSPTFVVPEAYVPKVGARVMSLQDPTRKMSKSDDNPLSYVALLDPPALIRKKVKRAVTDSGTEISYDPVEKAGIANLLNIFSAYSGESIEALVAHFEGKQYGHLKGELAELLVEELAPLQARYAELMADKGALEGILADGAEACQHRAARTLTKVHKKVGLVPRIRR